MSPTRGQHRQRDQRCRHREPEVTATLRTGAAPSAVQADPQLVGIYADFPSSASAEKALGYVDPEGQTCGPAFPASLKCRPADSRKKCQQKTQEAIAYVSAHLPLADWKQLVAGWDRGVRTIPGLKPAVYLNQSEYNTKGVAEFDNGSGYPAVFVAVTPITPAKPRILGTGANIVGYSAYYAPLTAKGACRSAYAYLSDVLSWGDSLSTVQFAASKLCQP